MYKELLEEYHSGKISLEEMRLKLFVEEQGLEQDLTNFLSPNYTVEQIKELIIIPGFFDRFEEYIDPNYSPEKLGFIRDAVYYDYDISLLNLPKIQHNEMKSIRKKHKIKNLFDYFVGSNDNGEEQESDIEYIQEEAVDLNFDDYDSLFEFLDGGSHSINIEENFNFSSEETIISSEEYFINESTLSYDHYIENQILKNAILIDKEDENNIFMRIDEKDYYNRFINGNIRLVIHFAKMYKYIDKSFFPDLIQHGFIGLINAMERFNPDLGYKFSTFGVSHLKQQMTRFLQDNISVIRIPVHKREELRKIEVFIRDYYTSNFEYPSTKDIGLEFSLNEEQVKENIKLINQCVSLFSLDNNDIEYLQQEYSHNPIQQKELELFLEYEVSKLIEETLKEREITVIRYRFGLNEQRESHTLAEIGEILNVSRERIRQIESKSIKKLSANKYSEEINRLYKFSKGAII